MPKGRKTKLERDFEADLNADLRVLFPGIYISKGNSAIQQGIPDRLLLFQDRWAMLEVKASETAEKQPNQEYFIDKFNEMSFAAFVYPENKEYVLEQLQLFFTPRARRKTRLS